MIILAFDTCLEKMYVVLKDDNRIIDLKVVETNETRYHSAYLISTIKNILKENGLKPADIDGIGINAGPGSFTGIRACVTVARVMAQQLNKKAVSVSSLEILSKINHTKKPSLVALDARKNSAYLYVDNEIKGAVQLEDIKKMTENDDYFVITDNKLLPILNGVSYQEKDYPLGEYMINLVEEKLKSTDGDWKKVLPLYIQPPPMG